MRYYLFETLHCRHCIGGTTLDTLYWKYYTGDTTLEIYWTHWMEIIAFETRHKRNYIGDTAFQKLIVLIKGTYNGVKYWY